MFYIKRQWFTEDRRLDNDPVVIERDDVCFPNIHTVRQALSDFLDDFKELCSDAEDRVAFPKVKHPTGERYPAYMFKLDEEPKAVYYIEDHRGTTWDSVAKRIVREAHVPQQKPDAVNDRTYKPKPHTRPHSSRERY